MKQLIIDIETIPDESAKRPEFDETSVKLGNIKDETKRAEKIEAEKTKFDVGLTKTMSLESDYCRIVSMGYIITDYGFNKVIDKGVIYGKKEDASILQTLSAIFNEHQNGLRIVGWNVKEFDVPVLWKRYLLTGQDAPFNYLECIKKYDHTACLDLMLIWNAYLKGKLSRCCECLGIKNKTGMDGSMIYDAWKANHMDDIKKYNMEDCEAVLAIAQRVGV